MQRESPRTLRHPARRHAYGPALVGDDAVNGKEREKVLFILSIVTGIALLAGSVMLVNERYRMRQLFVEHERAIDVERRLKDDQAELLMRVRRASLPSRISDSAASFGLVPVDGAHTVILEGAEAKKSDAPAEAERKEAKRKEAKR